jgi:hypothetical protein
LQDTKSTHKTLFAFPFTNNEQPEKEITKTTSFIIAPKI